MRVGKRPKVIEIKKTRSCVVRLEKVSKNSPNVSPTLEDNRYITRTNRISGTTMGATPKGRRGGVPLQQEDKTITYTAKKKVVGSNTPSSFPNPQQHKGAHSNMSNIRTSQKIIKAIPRSNKTTPPPSTPSREGTPPPTIAAGRSRRAIKPNPKYTSEDIVTPKVVRNVGMLASYSNRGASGQSRTRNSTSSSDDFYNRNSEDEYENDVNNTNNEDDDNEDYMDDDKAYQASEKDEDSDFSVNEEPVRNSRSRLRAKRFQEPAQPTTTQQITNKLTTPSANIKHTSTTTLVNSSNLRSAPSQIQQIRRSIASASTQRNLNPLVGSGGTTQKRKLEEIQDYTDNESGYSMKRKQILVSNSSGHKVKVPVRENRANVTSTSIIRSRLSTQPQAQKIHQHQIVNGSNKINTTQIASRRAIEVTNKSNTAPTIKFLRHSGSINKESSKIQNPITIQTNILASRTLRVRSRSPKLSVEKERQNNGTTISILSSPSSTSSVNITNKQTEKLKSVNSQSTKSAIPHSTSATNPQKVEDMNDDSPNSTMDDFETMPTFTIVNVNDIINKKGDVLITKAKSNSNKSPTVIELSESICLDDDEDEGGDNANDDDIEEVEDVSASVRPKQILSKKSSRLPSLNNKNEFENKKSPLIRSNESSNRVPQILNHKLGLRNSRISAKTTTTLTATLNPHKPAPRILNSMVAKKTLPVKPMIANMDDSADESFPLSLDEDEDEEVGHETEDEIESRNKNVRNITSKARKGDYQNLVEVDTEDTDSHNTEDDDVGLKTSKTALVSKGIALTSAQNTISQRKRRTAATKNTPFTANNNKKRITPVAAKENYLAATNKQTNDISTTNNKQLTLPSRKSNNEKVVISKQGDKIIKKITCFETWYVINMPVEVQRPTIMKNQLEMPLIHLANLAKNICLPNNMWSTKVTLYELSPQTLVKGTFVTYTGDFYEHNISEEDRGRYQPSCVMFRRSIEGNQTSRMPYDRAVIFKNKTFYTNIEGKNVRLLGAPSIIYSESEIEILLEVMDSLTPQSDFIEHISITQ